MKRVHGIALAGITVAVALSTAAGTAAAVTWTPVNSGTTEPITAIDYTRGQLRFATGAGNIFVRRPDGSFALEASFPGRQFFDIAFRPSGDVGLATADTGQLFRYSGGAWAPVSLANTSFDSFCRSGSYPPATPTGNLLAASWGTDAVAWVVSSETGQILRSVDAGLTWLDASRQADGSCHLDDRVTDVAAVPGSPNDAWFVGEEVDPWRTADSLATAVRRPNLAEECDTATLVRVAVDPAGPNRISAVNQCGPVWTWSFSADAGTTHADLQNGPPMPRDVAAGPGVFLAVGDDGWISETFDGAHRMDIPAGGALAHNPWLSAELADRAHAAIGGANGTLAVTDDADPRPTLVLGSGVRARRSGGRVRIRIRGRLRVPEGIPAAGACQGQVLLTVKRGRRQLAARNARVRPSCRFSKTITLSRRAVGGARRLTVVVRFGGNAQLGVRRKTLHVRVR
jgi:hypothetical protein